MPMHVEKLKSYFKRDVFPLRPNGQANHGGKMLL